MRQLVMSGYRATYGYDAKDERVAWVDSTEPGIHYTLRGLSNEILREVHELSGVWTWRKDYIFAGTTHIATVDSSGLTHVHKDHLGSTRVITNASGAKLSEHRYWPFGEEMTVTSSSERMRFAGHERDSQTSLDYMHARSYAPFGGRFVSADPGRDFDPAHPQSWNVYAYVRNNPVNAVDPDGRLAFAPIIIGAVVGGAGHVVLEMAYKGKPLSEALRGVPRAMAVGALGGVAKVGAFLAAGGQFYFAFREERRKGAETAEAATVALGQAGMVLVGSVAGGIVGRAAANEQTWTAVGAALSGEAATQAIQGADALKNELEPIMKDSSPQLKDKLEQIDELKRDEEEQTKRLVKVTDRTDPSKGQ